MTTERAIVRKKLRLFSMKTFSAYSPHELVAQVCERGIQAIPAPDDHIVMSRLHCHAAFQTQRLLEAPPDAVAFDRIALLRRHRETGARQTAVAAVGHFKQEKPPASLLATADGQEFGPFGQSPGPGIVLPVNHRPGPRRPVRR
ncbi:MAG: hypothetical protein H6889_00915 [Brucellaceae bacterium]|nr:hypothetical protein [Notoacmeibacter sp.]MCC0025538.1 hypothetical protein [Brucellaceae bacterium]